MKTLLITISVFLTASVNFAQNFNPFHSPTKYQQVNGSKYAYFYAEDSNTTGSSIENLQYQVESDSIFDLDVNNPCPSWGGTAIWAEKNWLGRKLSYNSQDKTLAVDNNMVFDFNLALGDSSIFYATGNLYYYLKHTSRSEENILGITDSVYGYSVLSYDNSNNLIPSQFSSTPIQIAKTLGAIRFIDIAKFPNAAVEYEITGQDHENIGHIGSYGLTYDDVYPWDIGDTLQCSGSNPTSEGGISSIITYTVTNRIESSDSVFIHLNKRIFSTVYQGGSVTYDTTSASFNILYDNVLKYKKNELIGNQPDQYIGYGTLYQNLPNELRVIDVTTGGYCDSCNCFAHFDAYLQGLNTHFYMRNFGLTYRSYEVFGGSAAVQAHLIFARVGNNLYGNYVNVGVDDVEIIDVKIAPNPTNEVLEINTSERMQNIEIYTATGAKCLEKTTQNQTESLNVNALEPGVYLVVITFENGQQSTQRIVKQ